VHFTNDFRVSVPVDEAWDVLTSVERIAPCMPGAELTGVEGDDYTGKVKVKLGPITAQYKGVASFESLDPDAHRAVLRASGREMRGQGNASARVVAQLTPEGDATRVSIDTDLTITGKVAQFGRGVIADVSSQLIQVFATNLEATLAADRPATGAAEPAADDEAAPSTAAAASAPVAEPEVESLDLLRVARGAVLKRAIPAAIVIVVVALAILALLL
jgi:carbon monoxide dehydrogenase subunit G